MKKSLTENRRMTLGDVIDMCVYRPYDDQIKFMITEDDKIVFEGDGWLVVMDSDKGEFHFSGELHKYYEVDVISSLRDSMGDIYSAYRLWDEGLKKDVYYQVVREEVDMEEERKRRQKEYYQEHKDHIKQLNKKHYLENREKKKEKYINKIKEV